ncbi:ralA-binding protein 1-A-like isoform X5 [Ruditapes philippinarum]|uniref:ralA-binding protein 1-A-like isoform X5 n=1 Tax=Ruditapes philippinarum TaxID=129788 RepID=UPI00295BFB47|nr:ralA-binding protein 1-A-like isoform X5 [Ruditapes philippinarum]
MSDSERGHPGSERKDGGKKKDGKKDKKEKGYVMFDADASDEDLVAPDDTKSPSKMKKGKAFRFGSKKDILSRVRDEKKDGKKEDKEKHKGEKKPKLKVKKKSKHRDLPAHPVPEAIEKPVFGVPLVTAIERNRSHDGVQLPALFRECIDYIEEHGLRCEGIYRISGVKSKVQHLKDLYNRGEAVYLEEHEPNIVAGVLKQFLRELPEPVLTNALIPKFEEASTIRNERRRIEGFLKLINELPQCNRLLLSWMIVHMTHVIERQKENKMTLQNVSIVLSPTMQISHRVLNVLFSHTKQLFKDTVIKRYVPPLKPATSRWSLELPDNPAAIQEELSKQESLLNQLHEELAAGTGDPEKEEQIWEVQRVCTQLKRKIKLAQKNQDTMEKRKRERDEMSKRNTVLEEGDEELRLELREPPECEVLNLELRKPPDEFQPTEPADEGEITPVPDAEEGVKQEQTEGGEPELEPESEKVESAKEVKQKELANQKVLLKELANQSKAKRESQEKELEKEHKEVVSEAVEENKTESDEKVAVNDEEEETDTKKVEENVEPQETSAEQKEEELGTESNVEQEIAVDDKVEEKTDVTAETIKADLDNKKAMLLQEDTTDSELGHSRESIQKTESESDEFEHSLEEILERDLNIESDKDLTDQEVLEDRPTVSEETVVKVEVSEDVDEPVAMETKTPVPIETPESPPATTPVPEHIEEPQEKVQDVSVDTVNGSELEISEISEDESISEEEYQKLLEEEYALKLEEEELLAIEGELRKKIETERCESERLQQEIDELQYLRQDSDEEILSTSSDSSYESEDEDDLQEILQQLIKENEELESDNSELCSNIHKERMICLAVKVQIGILQQKHVHNPAQNETFTEKESLIEFD